MAGAEIERLIQLLARLPGLGPRSARRAALALIKRPDSLMTPLARALTEAAAALKPCGQCGNVDTTDPCGLCADPRRDDRVICVVEEVGDLWALERSGAFRGRYHVLGGTLSALDGVTPEDLNVDRLIDRAAGAAEIVLALNPTVDGQTTAHYLAERLAPTRVKVTGLAQGVPLGGELDYLDEGTLTAAFRARRGLD